VLLAGFTLALAGIVVGSELLVRSSQPLIAALGLSETTFGMTILALVVSVEEVARELPAALKGRPDITFGNVLGSVLAFFLFNAGAIALVRPLPVSEAVLQFYLPVSVGTVVLISAVMWGRTVPRWAGAVLILLYLIFVAGGYVPLV
jgi:cation:H+ antiporter